MNRISTFDISFQGALRSTYLTGVEGTTFLEPFGGFAGTDELKRLSRFVPFCFQGADLSRLATLHASRVLDQINSLLDNRKPSGINSLFCGGLFFSFSFPKVLTRSFPFSFLWVNPS